MMTNAHEQLAMVRFICTLAQGVGLRTLADEATKAGDEAGAKELSSAMDDLMTEVNTMFREQVAPIVVAHADEVRAAYQQLLAGTLTPDLGVTLTADQRAEIIGAVGPRASPRLQNARGGRAG